jgi:hypothetical protein
MLVFRTCSIHLPSVRIYWGVHMDQQEHRTAWSVCRLLPCTSCQKHHSDNFAPHIICISHLARAAHFQDSTMSRDFRNKVLQRDMFADCPQHTIKIPSEITQALIKSWVPRIHTSAPSANVGRGELHIQLFLGWWSTRTPVAAEK